MENKVVVVGMGPAGVISARLLAEKGYKVHLLERRDHIAGNLYDEIVDGVLVHKYGPHIFHTKDDRAIKFLSKFTDLKDFHFEVGVEMLGKTTYNPFNFHTIDTYVEKEEADELKDRLLEQFGEKATIVELLESEDPLIKKYADFLYNHDYKLYTSKQWGIDPEEIDVSVLKRVPIKNNYNTEYFQHERTVLPVGGYTKMVENILDHENITYELSVDANERLSIEDGVVWYNNNGVATKPFVVYTGLLDELMGDKFKQLPYRSLRFEYKTLKEKSYQDFPLIITPEDKESTRVAEYTKLPPQDSDVTVVATEYPQSYIRGENEPYYPVLTEDSQDRHSKYMELVEKTSNLFAIGRLAEFSYYNMDQIVIRSIEGHEEILDKLEEFYD